MENKIREYLKQTKTMQLATTIEEKPWVCSVYFVIDDDLNIYWLSWPNRRHSQEILINSNVAACFVIKTNQPVVGVQVEGSAELIKDKKKIKVALSDYVMKYGVGEKFYELFLQNKNQHEVYRLNPKKYVLFDEANYPEAPRKEVIIA